MWRGMEVVLCSVVDKNFFTTQMFSPSVVLLDSRLLMGELSFFLEFNISNSLNPFKQCVKYVIKLYSYNVSFYIHYQPHDIKQTIVITVTESSQTQAAVIGHSVLLECREL